MTTTGAIAALKKTVDRIEALTVNEYSSHSLRAANNLVSAHVAVANGVVFQSRDHNNSRQIEIAAAKELQAAFVETYRAKGETARDEMLARISAELEALRAALPALAAQAAIEMGIFARDARSSLKAGE